VRIAHISDCYLPRLGGIEAQVHGLARRQLAAGHDVTVLTATAGPHGERHGVVDLVEGVPVHRLAVPLPFGTPVNPFAPRRVRAILLAGRFDVVHVHAGVVSPFAYDGAAVVSDLGRPMVVTWHCLLGRSERIGRLWARRQRWAAGPVAYTAVSDVAADPIRRILGPGREVTVLPNGVDVDAWRTVGPDAPPEREGAEVRLVSAMRLARRKRPMALLRMASEVRRQVPSSTPLRLAVLGSGHQRPVLEAYIRRHGMSSWVTLTGRLSHADMLETYRRSDVYVAPAVMESFGIAAIEARTAGLPVVARADSGIREFVDDGVEGLLAPHDSAIVDNIVRLVTDRPLRERISAHNRSVPPVQGWELVQARALAEYARATWLQEHAA
jgi:glycogen(starch) synthase